MAIDLVSGTALVVGIGSLILTWKATKSAKKAIDTSIEIYEKQKKDAEKKHKEIDELNLYAIKNVIKYEVMSVYMTFNDLYDTLLMIKNNGIDNVFIKMDEQANRLLVVKKGGNPLSGKVSLYNLTKAQEFLYDAFKLDRELANLFISLNMEYLRVNELLISLQSILLNLEDKKNHLVDAINTSEFFFKRFNELMDVVYKSCDQDGKSIKEMREKRK